MESNRKHIEAVLERIEAGGRRRVVLLGLAFKEGTDDLRGSAMLEIATRLLLRGYPVRIFDPAVSPANLMGANRFFAEAKLPDLNSLMIDDLSAALGDGVPTTLVVSKKCVAPDEIGRILLHAPRPHVVDLNGWRELQEAAATYEGLCW
jgi:GDP-mannose 6-dehydrogenase